MVVGLVGGGGGGDLEPRLSPWSMEELEAVDIVSLAFTVFKAFGFESIRWQRSCGTILWERVVVPVGRILFKGDHVSFGF